MRLYTPEQRERRRAKELERYSANSEEINKKRREARALDPDIARAHCDRAKKYYCNNKTKVSKRRAEHRAKPENRERARRLAKEWYEANKVRAMSACERWRANNPDKMKFIRDSANHKRRSRMLNAEGKFNKNDVIAIYERQKSLCAGCSRSIKGRYEIDHVIPLVSGGSNWPSNLQLLCKTCNRSKGAKSMSEWRNII